jgi:TPR repeat protein
MNQRTMLKLVNSCISGFVLGVVFLLPLHAQTVANAPAGNNPPPAAQAPDDTTKKITDLVHAGKYAEAQQLTTGLLVAYPDDERLIKAKALIEKMLAFTDSAGAFQPSDRPTSSGSSAQPAANKNAVSQSPLLQQGVLGVTLIMHAGVDTRGAKLDYIFKSGPAGLRPGDVITAVNETPIRNAGELQKVMSSFVPGMTLSISLLRKGEQKRTVITVLERSKVYGNDITVYDKEIATSVHALAEEGDADAQAELGRLYAEGNGVPKDYAQASMWYRKAADQGNAHGQTGLGWFYAYAEGKGVPQDYAQAAIWFRKAADQGDSVGQSGLGWLYSQGKGVPQDFAQSVLWFRKAADQDEASAQYGLAVLYMNGTGVPQDYAQAVIWSRKAADRGNAEPLTSMEKVDYNALIELGREAQQTTDAEEQKKLLHQFMDKSSLFLWKHWHETLLWELRAAAAISLETPFLGFQAGQELLAAGAADSSDPHPQQLLSQLSLKGWLDKQGAEDAQNKITKAAADTERAQYTFPAAHADGFHYGYGHIEINGEGAVYVGSDQTIHLLRSDMREVKASCASWVCGLYFTPKSGRKYFIVPVTEDAVSSRQMQKNLLQPASVLGNAVVSKWKFVASADNKTLTPP